VGQALSLPTGLTDGSVCPTLALPISSQSRQGAVLLNFRDMSLPVAVQGEALNAHGAQRETLTLRVVVTRQPASWNPAAVHKLAFLDGGQSGERKPRRVGRKDDADAGAGRKILVGTRAMKMAAAKGWAGCGDGAPPGAAGRGLDDEPTSSV